MNRRTFLLSMPALAAGACTHAPEAARVALSDAYLVKGLNALARSTTGSFFADGHRGAALIRAWLFTRENPLSADAVAMLDEWLRFNVQRKPLYDDLPAGDGAASPQDIVAALDERADQLQPAGHNVIFAAAALRALRQAPELATPAVCRGVCQMLRCFHQQDFDDVNEEMAFPESPGPRELTAFICRELLVAARQWEGRGNGFTGHLLTFGHAVVELFELGHTHVARKSLMAYERFVRRVRKGPSPGERSAHAPVAQARPLEPAFWAPRRSTPLGLGHTIKYLSSFYSVLRTVDDRETRDALMRASHHLF